MTPREKVIASWRTRREPMDVRFWRHVEKTGGCWFWTGGKTELGYGIFAVEHRVSRGAHRIAYELSVGPIPEGLQLDHLCRNPSCVRPEHLEPVTGRTNVLRGQTLAAANAAKTTCPRGHAYSGTNYAGRRICHICDRDKVRRYRERKAAVHAAQ